MRKFNLFVFMLIVSCSQQTAPPLNLEDDQKPISEPQNQRATLPEPPEATFASEENAPISSQASYNAEVELFRVGYSFEQFSCSCE